MIRQGKKWLDSDKKLLSGELSPSPTRKKKIGKEFLKISTGSNSWIHTKRKVFIEKKKWNWKCEQFTCRWNRWMNEIKIRNKKTWGKFQKLADDSNDPRFEFQNKWRRLSNVGGIPPWIFVFLADWKYSSSETFLRLSRGFSGSMALVNTHVTAAALFRFHLFTGGKYANEQAAAKLLFAQCRFATLNWNRWYSKGMARAATLNFVKQLAAQWNLHDSIVNSSDILG